MDRSPLNDESRRQLWKTLLENFGLVVLTSSHNLDIKKMLKHQEGDVSVAQHNHPTRDAADGQRRKPTENPKSGRQDKGYEEIGLQRIHKKQKHIQHRLLGKKEKSPTQPWRQHIGW